VGASALIASTGVNVIFHDTLNAADEAVLNPHTVDGRMLGDVASALVTEAGALFSGVCIGTGFCAEHAAIAAMVTAGEYKILNRRRPARRERCPARGAAVRAVPGVHPRARAPSGGL
jgi:hypothetical protein